MPVIEQRFAHTIRGLSMDAVQAANSGHPGAPMGMAELATVLWDQHLRRDPADPHWPDRDRVVLSNGHASMLLYSVLYLTGTALTLDDLRRFRQLGAPTAGHPEYDEIPGVETTTGPLGQGVGNGVGMALAERWLREQFGPELVDHHTWVFAGDGCLMEGISAEACSLAGHLGLGRLIVLYDDNRITIDGATDLTFSEDVAARYAAYGWHTLSVDGHDIAAIAAAMAAAKAEEGRPTLISCRTTIGRGSPKLAGSNKSHGSPLGPPEVAASKAALGLDPDAHFAVPDDVLAWIRRDDAARATTHAVWADRLAEHPQRERFQRFHAPPAVDDIAWPTFEPGGKLATRKASAAALQAAAATVENLIGGSADLAGSNGSLIKGSADIGPGAFGGRNLHFGIREHAMAAICNGLALHGGVHPYCATFLCFHDYMRPSVRLAALMHQPVTYIYTHDSIYLGEDGPTHQPVEHLMAMRLIPGLAVVRPADAAETVEAWRLALARRDGPTALCLTRQGLPILDRAGDLSAASGLQRGGYVLAEAQGDLHVVLIATGSEVSMALEARARLQADGVGARVVSLPCWSLFDAQDAAYRASVIPRGIPRVSVEAGRTLGWERYTGETGATIGIDRFGVSAPASDAARYLGLTATAVVEAARGVCGLV